ncbi:hypothetical protein [Knoellia subterranea]|uniref:hypothetical protein n=1 Tax=Knoellia subterranea TaxID=184882 RepID=UPI0012EB6306|nr:hypothetical protein [Knoellia subterranea]
MAVALSVILGTSAGAGSAFAGNTHTVNSNYHGCGDCNNPENGYIHPFTDTTATNGATNGKGEYLNRRGTLLTGSACNACTHVHTSWDTGSNRECQYYIDHIAQAPYAMNLNTHYAHNYSSYC